ncbi:MAG: VWA domain-containing protein [Verrucomicrobiae bacterium]|nr:VWA domain-containing protein [Verrucomicrobiae bacterium]NNJ85915.1 VWA domain-containing protein [Akkermansiaceae bacterium]
MSFLYPGWLLLLLLLPFILLGAILAHRGRNRAWKSMVAPRLRQQLVKEGSSTRRWIALGLGLLGCALIIAVIARPYRGETTTTEQIQTRNIIIAVDTSRSMLVRDVSPNRIGSAKAMAIELVDAFPTDRIGIIAFSGAPVLMAPLTIDHSAVHETISQLDTDVIPSGGSNLASTVQLAIKTFKKSGHRSNALIVISDGEDHSQMIDQAGRQIREAGIAVCAVGVGTKDGGIIPDDRRRDGKFRDLNGETVLSKLNPKALQQLTGAGHGAYVPASSGADSAIRSALSFLESDRQEGRKVTVPTESYQWFLFPAIILLAASLLVRSNLFSRKIPSPMNVATATLAALLLINQTTVAGNPIERAATAYENKDYEAALDLFSQALETAQGEQRRAIQFSQGGSAYRLKKWPLARRAFSQALLTKNKKLQEQAHYNLGNSLFQSGWSLINPPEKPKTRNPFLDWMRQLLSSQPPTTEDQRQLTKDDVQQIIINWQDAISHYQAAIDLNPDNQQAEDNRVQVEKLLKQLQDALKQAEKEQEQANKEQQGEGEKPNNQREGDGNNPEQDPDKNGEGNENKDPESSDNGDNENNESGEKPENQPENEQPMEPREGESKEAFAARILKEHSDAETRPVNRRMLRLRRPAKDW